MRQDGSPVAVNGATNETAIRGCPPASRCRFNPTSGFASPAGLFLRSRSSWALPVSVQPAVGQRHPHRFEGAQPGAGNRARTWPGLATTRGSTWSTAATTLHLMGASGSAGHLRCSTEYRTASTRTLACADASRPPSPRHPDGAAALSAGPASLPDPSDRPADVRLAPSVAGPAGRQPATDAAPGAGRRTPSPASPAAAVHRWDGPTNPEASPG